MDLPNLWLWSGLRIGPQLMDGLGAGRSPPRSKEEEEEAILHCWMNWVNSLTTLSYDSTMNIISSIIIVILLL